MAPSACRPTWPERHPGRHSSHQAYPQGIGPALSAEAEIQGNHGFEPPTARRVESAGSPVCRNGPQQGVGHGHHLHRHRRGLALPRRYQGSVQRRTGGLRPRCPDDAAVGHAGAIPCRCHQAAEQGADPPFGSRQPVLLTRRPTAAPPVRHAAFHESQGELLG